MIEELPRVMPDGIEMETEEVDRANAAMDRCIAARLVICHSVVSAGQDGMRITPCEVCRSFAETLRIADTRAPRTLSASESQRLVDLGR